MEELIVEIQKRDILWNKKHSRYYDRFSVDREWNYVAECTGFTKDEAKKKWRNLRDRFSKELKNIPKHKSDDAASAYPGKWQYFTALLFLKDSLTPRYTEGNVSDIRTQATVADAVQIFKEFSELDDRDGDISSDQEHETPPVSSKYATTLLQQSKRKKDKPGESFDRQFLDIEAKKLAALEKPDDDDLLFLRSLLPYFKEMDLIQKLRVRTKFHNILIEEMTHPLRDRFYNHPSNSNPCSIMSDRCTNFSASPSSTVDAKMTPFPSLTSNFSVPSSPVIPASLKSSTSDIFPEQDPLSVPYTHY